MYQGSSSLAHQLIRAIISHYTQIEVIPHCLNGCCGEPTNTLLGTLRLRRDRGSLLRPTDAWAGEGWPTFPLSSFKCGLPSLRPPSPGPIGVIPVPVGLIHKILISTRTAPATKEHISKLAKMAGRPSLMPQSLTLTCAEESSIT
ncbi:Hypothetical predicted protein, partial [Pelobates cultripes]